VSERPIDRLIARMARDIVYADLVDEFDRLVDAEDRQDAIDCLMSIAVRSFCSATGIDAADIGDARLELEGGVLSLVYTMRPIATIAYHFTVTV
jgi:hypothetical protein